MAEITLQEAVAVIRDGTRGDNEFVQSNIKRMTELAETVSPASDPIIVKLEKRGDGRLAARKVKAAAWSAARNSDDIHHREWTELLRLADKFEQALAIRH